MAYEFLSNQRGCNLLLSDLPDGVSAQSDEVPLERVGEIALAQMAQKRD